MQMPKRKSRLQRALGAVGDSLDVRGGIRSALPGVSPGKAVKAAFSGKPLKAGLIAGSLAGLTAGSAGISSRRRRDEGARDDS